MTDVTNHRQGGLPYALGAYVIWGLLPLYLRLLHDVPPFAFVGWRAVFTLPVCLFVIAVLRQWPELRAALANPRLLGLLALSSLLIGGNWLIYVAAIQAGHVFAASIGYYINPLLNVVLGTLFLGEKLRKRQWLAVALAAAGVALLAWDARDMMGISLALAGSFGLYGLVRKLAPVGALTGLTIETGILLLPALIIIQLAGSSAGGFAMGQDMSTSLLLALSGVLTAAPLLMFAVAARRMDYSTMGFVQYVSPTLVFLMGLFLFHEPLKQTQMACFIIIWAAIGLFSWDLLAQHRAQASDQPATNS